MFNSENRRRCFINLDIFKQLLIVNSNFLFATSFLIHLTQNLISSISLIDKNEEFNRYVNVDS